MWLIGTTASGFSPGPALGIPDLEPVTRLGGPAAAAEPLFLALDLFFAAFHPVRLQETLCRLGFAASPGEVEVQGETLPDQASWTRPEAPRALLDPDGDRTLRVGVRFALDPGQYRILREQAAREPALVNALAGGAEMEVTVGFLFNRTLTSVSISTLAVEVAGERVPAAGTERPPWLNPFLGALAPRFRVLGRLGPDPAEAWLEALLSPDPRRHGAAERVRETLAGPPFHLDRPRPVRWGGDGAVVVSGPHGRPLTWDGPGAMEALALAVAAQLDPAEILAVSRPGYLLGDPGGVAAWLASLVDDPSGPLEQVLVGGVDDADARSLERPQVDPAGPLPGPGYDDGRGSAGDSPP